MAVIQAMPVFDETKILSVPLPAALGTSLSFSFALHVYLVLMFLGRHWRLGMLLRTCTRWDECFGCIFSHVLIQQRPPSQFNY